MMKDDGFEQDIFEFAAKICSSFFLENKSRILALVNKIKKKKNGPP
jgi:hypothetical protein